MKDKGYKLLMGVLLAVFALFLIFQASQPKPIDWRKTYSPADKIPFGLYVFYEILKETTNNFKPVEKPPFDFINDSTANGSYIFVANTMHFDSLSLRKLYDWVGKGNTLLIAAENSNFFQSDSLNLKSNTAFFSAQPKYNLVNPKIKRDSAFSLNHSKSSTYFSRIDTVQHKVVGELFLEADWDSVPRKEVNFIEIPHEKGRVLLHTNPEVFTNLFVLKDDNIAYVENLLGYLNLDETIYFDLSNLPKNEGYAISPLYVFLQNKYLRWSYYFLGIGAFLFILFEGKRKQRVIKIIEPLENKSFEFARTVSDMYLGARDHSSIAHKQIEYFYDYLQNELKIDVHNKNLTQSHLVSQISAITQSSQKEVEEVLKYIKIIENRPNREVSQNELLALNTKINTIKN